ncbi:MAG: DUF2127 domain-containing protein [Verrucomicrobiia bacterium]
MHAQARRHHDLGFLIIAVLKLVKGALLLLVGLGTLSLLDKNVMARVSHWAHALPIDWNRHIIQNLLLRLGVVAKRDIGLISATTFFLAALLLTEGIGLLLEKVWAEYLTFVFTASFIPIEVYKLTQHVTPARLAALAINVVIAAYLALRLHQRAMARRRERGFVGEKSDG